ncbi:MAG: hypothetical protein DRJ51_09200, partial [Thermoprotei archaeon]
MLPVVGLAVKGLSKEDFNSLLENYQIFYPELLLVELYAVIVRQIRKEKLKEIPRQAIEGLNSIIYLETINLVPPDGGDLEVICELVNLGWKDVFDAILYATATRLNMKILTMDMRFKEFLKRKGLKHEILISHKQLMHSPK